MGVVSHHCSTSKVIKLGKWLNTWTLQQPAACCLYKLPSQFQSVSISPWYCCAAHASLALVMCCAKLGRLKSDDLRAVTCRRPAPRRSPT
jgi:hypothetical protein